MKHRILTSCTIVLGALAATSAAAQTTPAAMPAPTKAEKVADVRYNTIETMTTKPGARTWTIISKHFMPAARAAGLPMPLVYHTETGESKTIVVTPLTGGMGDLEWSTSPDDVKFFAALAKQEGGMDKAMALYKEFNDGIATRSRELVHEHTK